MIMMIHFWCKLVSRQQKIWATQQAFSWGNVSIFCIFAPSHHGYQRPQYFYFSLAPSPILKDLWNFEVRVGWFTLVNHCWLVYPCREFSMMLNISHSPLQTDMKGGNHCQNEKILALVVPHNKRRLFFLYFFTPGLSYCHIVVVANNIWLVRFFIKRRDTGGALRCC